VCEEVEFQVTRAQGFLSITLQRGGLKGREGGDREGDRGDGEIEEGGRWGR
jgi:hypothetical protein